RPGTAGYHDAGPLVPRRVGVADTPFFACGPDHKLLTDGHHSATVTNTGRLAWTNNHPHPNPEREPQINHAHHPDELLRGDPDPPRN
ncbi:MAG: HNH nuclease, partial [Actinomycetia bacterium]|nr:HNH nuclease [Actinomycetes bacterium]